MKRESKLEVLGALKVSKNIVTIIETLIRTLKRRDLDLAACPSSGLRLQVACATKESRRDEGETERWDTRSDTHIYIYG